MLCFMFWLKMSGNADVEITLSKLPLAIFVYRRTFTDCLFEESQNGKVNLLSEP